MLTQRKLPEGRYEAHITLDQSQRSLAQKAADMWGWVFSEISGCPILGQGTYCYLTSYNTNAYELKTEMEQLAAYLGRHGNLPLLRLKIENIVYDTKTNVNEL